MSGDTSVSIPSLARYLGRSLADFVYPPHCATCRTWLAVAEDILCPGCWLELETEPGRQCQRCGCPLPDLTQSETSLSTVAADDVASGLPRHSGPGEAPARPPTLAAPRVESCPNCRSWDQALERVLVWGAFEGVMQEAVHALKFGRHQSLGCEMGRRLGVSPRFVSSLAAIDLLVPVPLHPARQRERGYNQSLCIAAGLAAVADKPLRPDLVRRRRATRQQARLDADERALNLAEAFEGSGDVPTGVRIGLVDDVVTTGTTLTSCCKALKNMGIASVWGIALASPYPRSSATDLR